MGKLIDREALLQSMGIENVSKYGHESAADRDFSYSTLMRYEVADAILDAPVVADDPAPADPVHHPTHYNADDGMECIEEMLLVFGREAVMHFCACNVWKYRYRANGKDGEKDLQKAHEYMRIYERLKQEGGAVG